MNRWLDWESVWAPPPNPSQLLCRLGQQLYNLSVPFRLIMRHSGQNRGLQGTA